MSPATRLLTCWFLLLCFVSAAVAAEPRIRFAPPVNYPVGVLLESIAAGDLNGDGAPDLVTVDQKASNVYVLLNNGDGTFAPAVPYSLGDLGGGWPTAVAVADVNNDGKYDVIVGVTNGVTGVHTFLGNGDGTLQAPIASTSAAPWSIAVGDLNGDGKMDLFMGGNGAPVLALGNGDGTFTAVPLTVPVANFCGCAEGTAAIADLNGDGKLDLFAGDGYSSDRRVVVWYGNGDGTFQDGISLPIQANFNTRIIVGAVNLAGNGKLDIVSADSFGISSLLPVNADGSYGSYVSTYGGTTPSAILSADFNHDTFDDVAFADSNYTGVTTHPDGFGVSISPGAADGTLDFSHGFVQFGANIDASWMAIADFNHDGLPDIATSNVDGTVAVLLNGLNTTVTATTSATTAAPTPPGQATTITITVAQNSGAPMPTGTITLLDTASSPKPVVVGSGTLDANGVATLSFTLSETSRYLSEYILQALYSGDASYVGSTSDPIYTYVGEPTTTTVQANPSSTSFGSSVGLSATVTAQGVIPTGRVLFYDGTTYFANASLINGSVAFTTTSLGVGAHTIHAYYDPDATSASLVTSEATAPVTIVQGLAATTTSLVASPPPDASTPIILGVTVTSTSGSPTGTVTFSDGSTLLATQKLSNGTAGLSASLGGGSHTITVAYSGDTNFAASSSSAVISIRYVSTTELAVTPGDALSPTKLTVTVSGASGSPTGSVTLNDGTTTIGGGAIVNGVGIFTVNLSAGTHDISAVYTGDANYGYSTGKATVTIPLAASSTTLSLSANPTAGGKLTLSATVSATVPPAGTVTFNDGSTVLGTASVSNGAAAFTIASLAAGSHSFTASFSGTGFAGSSSAAQNITVAQDFAPPAPTSNALTVNPGGSATLTLNVAPEPGGFSSTVTLACSGAPAGATCSISPNTVTPGSSGASATMTVTTTGTSAALRSSRSPLFALWLPLAGISLCGAGFGRKRRWALLAVSLLLALAVMVACGGGGSSSSTTTTPPPPTTQGSTTPSGTYALTVTATSGSIQHSTVINLTVK